MNFNCINCGKCCNRNGIVYFDLNDVINTSKFLKITTDKFIKKFLNKDDENRFYTKSKNKCAFYKDNECKIYNVRPYQCKSYPFWYNIIKSKKNWNNEAKTCKGITI